MRYIARKKGDYVYYSIIKDITKDGKRTTEIVENIGNEAQLRERAGNEDPIVWLDKYVESLNKEHQKKKATRRSRTYTRNPNNRVEKGKQTSYDIGYLFLQKIFHGLKLDEICNNIKDRYKIEYDLTSILSRLIYGRVLFPCSKKKTTELSQNLLEKPNFTEHQVYRALDVICDERDFIQAELYKNSKKAYSRNNRVLYYDCTNFFFESDEETDLKKYSAASKEHRPNPIVQMGLLIDGDGVPLAFDIAPGNTNEQVTLKPLEERIIQDFGIPNLVVCTDAGLSSLANRKLNNTYNRRFITTQSLKNFKEHLRDWSLDLTKGWRIFGDDRTYNISALRDNQQLINKYKNTIFYKERWINEDGLEQRLIVTYSVKYQEFLRAKREAQFLRAEDKIDKKRVKDPAKRANSPDRFIVKTMTTKDGEVATKKSYSLDFDAKENEELYDGIYAVCTNLEDSVDEILRVCSDRWQIEDSFRLTKSFFKARPVFVSNDNRIIGHFTTCFLALLFYKILDKQLDRKYTATQIIEKLREMKFYEIYPNEYVPNYVVDDLTDDLHKFGGFYTDFEVITKAQLNIILKRTQK